MQSLLIITSWLITILIGASWFLIIAFPFIIGLGIFLVAPPIAAMVVTNRITIKRKSTIRVLVVDDQPSSLIILEHIFKGLKWEYKVANSGWEALKVMKKEAFNLIVMDYEMPNLSGPETILLAENYKSKKHDECKLSQYKDVPIVGFTCAEKPAWNLPKMRRFSFRTCLNKQCDYKQIREQIHSLWPSLQQLA